MVIYGFNPVLEALRSHPKRIHYIGVARDQQGKVRKIVVEAQRLGIPIRHLTPDQIQKLASGVHNGVIAGMSQGAYSNFHDIVARPETRFVLILDGIQDPQNFGAILRVADSFGVHLVVIPEHESVGLTPAAVKAAAGASEWVPVAQVTNLARAIEHLKENEYWVYAAETGGDPITKVDFSGKVAIVLGNEGKGIRRNVAEHCDRRISIPMYGHVESLNVAAAAAVVCYEVVRGSSQ